MLKNFFGILKAEIFYEREDNYKTLDNLIKAIDHYFIIIIMIELK